MAMQGSLKDMDVANLIQHNCQDRKMAQLDVERNGIKATLFFKDGDVSHAVLDNLEGEEVVYRIINWNEGQFSLELGIEPPKVTIQRSWSGLLLEAAKRLDEGVAELVDDLAPVTEKPMVQTEVLPKKGQQLANTLAQLLEESSDIEGVAVVDLDGSVYAAHVPAGKVNEEMVGTASAAIFGLSKRSVQQLKRGNFKQIFIEGKDGNIIVSGLNEQTLFIGLIPHQANLGLVFAEVRDMTAKLKQAL